MSFVLQMAACDVCLGQGHPINQPSGVCSKCDGVGQREVKVHACDQGGCDSCEAERSQQVDDERQQVTDSYTDTIGREV